MVTSNEHHRISNHQQHYCLFKTLFGLTQMPKFHITHTFIVRGIHRWLEDSPHKWPITRNVSPCHDVTMYLIPLRLHGSNPTQLLTGGSLQMVFCIFGAKPLFEATMIYSQFEFYKQTSVKNIWFKINKANLRDLIAATGLIILLISDSNHHFFGPWNLMDDLRKLYGSSSMLLDAMYVIS